MLLDVSQVNKSYVVAGEDYPVLKQLDLHIKQGSVASILGRSGSGKTTLLNIIGGLDAPTSGQVLLKGQDLYALGEKERTALRRKHIGFVFQSFNLLPVLTARENVELPGEHTDKAYINELFETLEISDKVHSLPSQLSGGQQQRVAIARALVNRPDIILADEPTGNLDEKSEEIVMQMFRQLVDKYDTSIILITHNLALVEQTDIAYRLEGGALVR